MSHAAQSLSLLEEKRNPVIMNMSDETLALIIADASSLTDFDADHPIFKIAAALGMDPNRIGALGILDVVSHVAIELAFRNLSGSVNQ